MGWLLAFQTIPIEPLLRAPTLTLVLLIGLVLAMILFALAWRFPYSSFKLGNGGENGAQHTAGRVVQLAASVAAQEAMTGENHHRVGVLAGRVDTLESRLDLQQQQILDGFQRNDDMHQVLSGQFGEIGSRVDLLLRHWEERERG